MRIFALCAEAVDCRVAALLAMTKRERGAPLFIAFPFETWLCADWVRMGRARGHVAMGHKHIHPKQKALRASARAPDWPVRVFTRSGVLRFSDITARRLCGCQREKSTGSQARGGAGFAASSWAALF
jgi:hypothetical protein